MKYFIILSWLRIDIRREHSKHSIYVLVCKLTAFVLCFQMRHSIRRHGQGKQDSLNINLNNRIRAKCKWEEDFETELD